MPGSPTAIATWPGPGRLIGRLAVCALIVLGGIQVLERSLVKPLLPTFCWVMSSLDDRFVVTDARLVRTGPNEVVRFRVNLAAPLVVGSRILYPFGTHGVPEGGFQVTNTVGGVLQLGGLLLIVVLAWPARHAVELALRLGVALPVMAALVLLDTPFTAVAELRNGLATTIDPQTVDGWMVASRFLMGGGGYALAILLAAGSIALTRWCLERAATCSRRPRWETVTQREFDTFFRVYPRPLRVHPPFDCHARRHTLMDRNLGSGADGPVVAECRLGGRRSRYRIRADLLPLPQRREPTKPSPPP